MKNSIHELLREKTKFQHQELENKPVSLKIISSDLNCADYANYLARLLSLFDPLESEIKSLVGSPFAQEVGRERPLWLKQDLMALGSEPWPRAQFLSPRTSAEALGALYVLEGSHLGGQLIVKKLQLHAFIQPENTNYFRGRGAQTGSRWKYFMEQVREFHAQHGAHEEEQLVTGAQRTFETLARLF